MRSKLAVALVLFVAIPAFAGDLEDAQALKAGRKFAEALPKFQAAAAAAPDDAAAALGLSEVLAGLGRYEEAAKAVDTARKAHPDDAALLTAKARAYYLRLATEEAAAEPDGSLVESLDADAMKWVGMALKADPKHVAALVLKGELHQKHGDEQQALLFFQEAAKNDPKDFDAAYAVGNHWFRRATANKKDMDAWANAESGFYGALRIDPTSAAAATNLAHCKAWQRQPGKDVANAYLKAYALAPANEELLKKACEWMPSGERVAMCQKLVDEAPDAVVRRIYLAFALMKAKEHAKARDVLEAASKLEPGNPYVPLNEGDVTLDEGKKVDDAIDFYVEAMTLFRQKGGIDNATYDRLAGSVAFMHPKLAEPDREKLWTALWKLFPDRAGGPNNAGLWYRDVGKDFKKSLEWYLRAAKAAPEDCCIQNDAGLIYHYHMNDFDKAEPYYRKAVEIGNREGYDCNAGNDPDRGFRDALNNMYKILSGAKRWKELLAFAENEVPDTHPMRDAWIRQAQEKK